MWCLNFGKFEDDNKILILSLAQNFAIRKKYERSCPKKFPGRKIENEPWGTEEFGFFLPFRILNNVSWKKAIQSAVNNTFSKILFYYIVTLLIT